MINLYYCKEILNRNSSVLSDGRIFALGILNPLYGIGLFFIIMVLFIFVFAPLQFRFHRTTTQSLVIPRKVCMIKPRCMASSQMAGDTATIRKVNMNSAINLEELQEFLCLMV